MNIKGTQIYRQAAFVKPRIRKVALAVHFHLYPRNELATVGLGDITTGEKTAAGICLHVGQK